MSVNAFNIDATEISDFVGSALVLNGKTGEKVYREINLNGLPVAIATVKSYHATAVVLEGDGYAYQDGSPVSEEDAKRVESRMSRNGEMRYSLTRSVDRQVAFSAEQTGILRRAAERGESAVTVYVLGKGRRYGSEGLTREGEKKFYANEIINAAAVVVLGGPVRHRGLRRNVVVQAAGDPQTVNGATSVRVRVSRYLGKNEEGAARYETGFHTMFLADENALAQFKGLIRKGGWLDVEASVSVKAAPKWLEDGESDELEAAVAYNAYRVRPNRALVGYGVVKIKKILGSARIEGRDGEPTDAVELFGLITSDDRGGRSVTQGVKLQAFDDGAAAILARGKVDDDIIVSGCDVIAEGYLNKKGQPEARYTLRGGDIFVPQTRNARRFFIVRGSGNLAVAPEVGKTGNGSSAGTLKVVSDRYSAKSRESYPVYTDIPLYGPYAEALCGALDKGMGVAFAGGLSRPSAFIIGSGERAGEVASSARVAQHDISVLRPFADREEAPVAEDIVEDVPSEATAGVAQSAEAVVAAS